MVSNFNDMGKKKTKEKEGMHSESVLTISL